MADEVARFATDMRTAADRQVDVLSPSAYHQADEALKSAQSDEQKGKDRKEILHEVAKGRAQLNRANQSAELSRTNMDDVVTARQAAMAAGAPKAFAEDFKKADEHLISLTSEIEDNNLSNVAENRGKLQKEYLDVELKAIKQTNLGAAQATVAIAVKEGAKEYAQQSLAIAEKNINDTEAFIVANRHDTVAVKSRSDEAIAAANHLLKITRAAKSGKNISPEQVALSLEKEQNRTQQERNELTAERQNAKELAIETGDLKSEQAFNRSFEAARSEFTSNEAEVYRQGNRLVIRLRALEFPVNQAVLRGENFPLLAKVAKVVKGFENPTVVIEGHTDSDGGKALNKKLSSERARAISDYLVSSQAIGAGRISAVGYGFERPLSSNKSAKGRAENRRVDVVITPQVMGG
ncbi:unnamed protein product [Sphagnum balticum]